MVLERLKYPMGDKTMQAFLSDANDPLDKMVPIDLCHPTLIEASDFRVAPFVVGMSSLAFLVSAGSDC